MLFVPVFCFPIIQATEVIEISTVRLDSINNSMASSQHPVKYGAKGARPSRMTEHLLLIYDSDMIASVLNSPQC